MKYNIQLTPEQADILNGKKGETMAKVMETLVMFGDIFGAKRMVEVTHKEGHLVTSFGIGLLKPLYKTMDRLIADGIKTQGTFTVDPRPLDRENVKYSLLDRLVNEKIMYSQQKHYEEQLKAVGLKDANAFTCACYLDEVGNIPKKGDILSWAESSAVVYANSVLGARCNRNSGMLDLFGSIVGCVPEFGLLTDEGRKATWIVKVETTKIPEAQILGSAIGMKVVEDVPYVYGLDKWIGSELTDERLSQRFRRGNGVKRRGRSLSYRQSYPRSEGTRRKTYRRKSQSVRYRRRGTRKSVQELSEYVEKARQQSHDGIRRLSAPHLHATQRVDGYD